MNTSEYEYGGLTLSGITTTIDSFLHSPPYLFDTIEASSMRFAGVIGTLCGMTSPLTPSHPIPSHSIA